MIEVGYNILWTSEDGRHIIENKIFMDRDYALQYAKTFQHKKPGYDKFKIHRMQIIRKSLLEAEQQMKELEKEKLDVLRRLPKDIVDDLLSKYNTNDINELANKMLGSDIVAVVNELIKKEDNNE